MSDARSAQANVPVVIWAFRSPSGKRWCHATLWRQPQSPTRLIIWSDQRRERLTWYDDHAEAVAEAERLRQRLVAKGWRFEAQLETASGWVIVDTQARYALGVSGSLCATLRVPLAQRHLPVAIQSQALKIAAPLIRDEDNPEKNETDFHKTDSPANPSALAGIWLKAVETLEGQKQCAKRYKRKPQAP